jgi:hypothetical protein
MAGHDVRDWEWRPGAPEVPIDDGRTFVPIHMSGIGRGRKSVGTLTAEFEVRNGVPECIAFSMEAVPGGRGIRTTDLRVFNIDALVQHAFLLEATRIPEGGSDTDQAVRPVTDREFWALRASLDRARQGQRGKSSLAELAEVARVYRENIEDSPTLAVANDLGYTARTAARRVSQARALKLLPATTQGKAKS